MKVAPAGKELVKEVVHEIDRLAAVVGEKEAVLRRKREELAKAEEDLASAKRDHAAADAKLEALLRGAVCAPENGCAHEHVNGMHAQEANGVANGVYAKSKAKFAALEDKEKKIVWRIAFQLLDDPFLDYAESFGALDSDVILVHLTDAREAELRRIAEKGARVVLCPRSNLHIKRKLPPLLAVLAAELAPALGTDSLASNASLDVLAEARALADRFPSVSAVTLFEMVTVNGAAALGRADLGRVAKGTRPGLFAVEGTVTNDPAGFVLGNVKAPRRMLVGKDLS